MCDRYNRFRNQKISCFSLSISSKLYDNHCIHSDKLCDALEDTQDNNNNKNNSIVGFKTVYDLKCDTPKNKAIGSGWWCSPPKAQRWLMKGLTGSVPKWLNWPPTRRSHAATSARYSSVYNCLSEISEYSLYTRILNILMLRFEMSQESLRLPEQNTDEN